MKKRWSGKEVKTIFKNLDDLCKKEIKFHKENFRIYNEDYYNNKSLYEEQRAFIDGIEQVRKYLIKQYFNIIVKDIVEGEDLSSSTSVIIKNIKVCK